jgi:hypothetical protein
MTGAKKVPAPTKAPVKSPSLPKYYASLKIKDLPLGRHDHFHQFGRDMSIVLQKLLYFLFFRGGKGLLVRSKSLHDYKNEL